MKQKQFWKRALFWILFSLAAGGISAAVTSKGRARFETVPQPPLSPPRILFPIVWSVLLILIGLGFAIVLEKASEPSEREGASAAYAVQMTFFFCWMIWFFGLSWYGFSSLWLAGMIVSILVMILVYRRISPAAAWLQVPYLLWCCFALYLNIGIWRLNP